MCLMLRIGEKEQVAKEDIMVYKVIWDNNSSLYNHFKYTPNTTFRLRKPLKKQKATWTETFYEINQGFHSYANEKDAGQTYNAYVRAHYRTKPVKLVEFVIPKGAKYYLGEYEGKLCYVSTSIRSGDLSNTVEKDPIIPTVHNDAPSIRFEVL